MIKKFFLLLIIACFLPTFAFSNDATISKAPSSGKSKELENIKEELKSDLKELGVKIDDKSPVSLQMIDLYRAQDEYKKKKTKKNKFKLVVAYENVLPKTCIPNIYKDLTFEKENFSKECLEMIKETKDLYKHSPIVACLENGYASKECKEAYTHVVLVDRYDEEEKENKDESSDVNDFFEKLDQGKIPALKDALNKAIGDYRVTSTVKNYLNAMSAANKLAKNVCQNIKYFYSDTCMTCNGDNHKIGNLDFFGTKEKEDTKEYKDIEEETEKIEDKEDKIFDKNIFIPEDCKEFLSDMKNFEPKYPNIVCLKEDPFSPLCLKAVKVYRDNLRTMVEKEKATNKKLEVIIPDDGKNFDTF